VLRDPAELRLDPPAVANAVLLVPVQTFTAESARAADAVDP
jgi:hypothetical protein